MAKKQKAEKTEGKARKVSFSEFNPCRARAKGRPSERVYWVEELVNAGGRNIKDIFEKASQNWAKAMVKERGGDHDEFVELYKSNIPGTPSDTKRMLETLIPMIAKKVSQEFTYELDGDNDLTVEFSPLSKKAKAKAEAKPATKTTKKAVKAAAKDEEDEDEDSDDSDDDEDEDDEDED